MAHRPPMSGAHAVVDAPASPTLNASKAPSKRSIAVKRIVRRAIRRQRKRAMRPASAAVADASPQTSEQPTVASNQRCSATMIATDPSHHPTAMTGPNAASAPPAAPR